MRPCGTSSRGFRGNIVRVIPADEAGSLEDAVDSVEHVDRILRDRRRSPVGADFVRPVMDQLANVSFDLLAAGGIWRTCRAGEWGREIREPRREPKSLR